jgi:phosphoribosylanthranilate isomerase
VFVKICGITRLEDAEAAAQCGASAVGFVFWPDSPRFLDPYRARAIAAALPLFVTTVGVFVNQPLEYVAGVASLVHLGAVQLHGDETMAYASRIRPPVVKAIPVRESFDVASAERWPQAVTLLLDVDDPARRGGTGRTIDWSQAAVVAARRRVMLAGGLTPENVGGAIGTVRPFGIDVSSGVEVRPGVKDYGRMVELFNAVRREAAGGVASLEVGLTGSAPARTAGDPRGTNRGRDR